MDGGDEAHDRVSWRSSNWSGFEACQKLHGGWVGSNVFREGRWGCSDSLRSCLRRSRGFQGERGIVWRANGRFWR